MKRTHSFSASPYPRPTSPLYISGKQSSERPVSPASSAGSHASGVSHPPGSRTKRRKQMFTNVPSDELLGSVDNWDDGYSASRFLPSPSLFYPSNDRTSISPNSSPTREQEFKFPSPHPLSHAADDHASRQSLMNTPPKDLECTYSCQYCNRRFKDKVEVGQHQNFHFRRYSWSCAALQNFQAAFYASISSDHQAEGGSSHDTCGYCGLDFSSRPEPDWDERFEHLRTAHKFGECNRSKKFFRAMHFRQHLKHSHSGVTGRWTDSLVNTCLKEEQEPLGPEASNPCSNTSQTLAAFLGTVPIPRPSKPSSEAGAFSCLYQGCTLRFGSHAELLQHDLKAHRPTKPDSMVARQTSLHHSQIGPRKCERINSSTGKPCNSIFSEPHYFRRHEERIHNAPKSKVRCDFCTEEKIFSRNDALIRHIRVVHPEVDSRAKQRRRDKY